MQQEAVFGSLTISAPCPWCVAAWLPAGLERLPVNSLSQHDALAEVCVRDGDGRTLRSSYYPHPECRRHAAMKRASARPLSASPVAPVQALCLQRSPAGGPSIVAAVMPSPRQAGVDGIVGRGVDRSPQLAQLKATMEALERQCTYLPPRERLAWATPSELGARARGASSAPADKPRWWCELASLGSRERVFVPLEYVQLDSACRVADPVRRSDSTGMAIHTTHGCALRAGLCEAVERAGVARMWAHCDYHVASDDWMTRREDLQSLSGVVCAQGYGITLLWCDVLPSFTTCIVLLARRRECGRGPALVCGAGADPSSTEAAARALSEAYAQLQQALDVWPMTPLPGLPRPCDHLLFYLDAENASGLVDAWGLARQARKPLPDHTAADAVTLVTAHVEVLVAQRGNTLTDYLDLSALQVVLPDLPPLAPDTPGPSGWPAPFG